MKCFQATAAILLLLLIGCSSRKESDIAYQKILSPNQNERVKYIILHYTGGDFKSSVDILTNNSDLAKEVSAHYLIPESRDSSYHFKEIKVFQLVDNNKRAWHAGRSAWKKSINVNDQSIGIELVNRARCQEIEGKAYCYYPDYDPQQLRYLILTLDDLMRRYPHIQPTDIIGHSDVAPERKIDPGPRFPWELLYQQGHGAWFDYDTMVRYAEKFTQMMPDPVTIRHALKKYGYGIEVNGGCAQQICPVISAFQRHFVQDNITGVVDVKTAAVLFALLEKYYPDWVAPSPIEVAEISESRAR